MNERLVALDVGDARIGVAVSDMSRMIATPIETIHRVGFGPDVKRVLDICRQQDTTLIVSGLPLNLSGTEGPQAQKVRLFCQQLEKAGLTVYYQDERLTTVTAEKALLEDNMHRAQRRQNVDKVAAAIILQQYLDAQREAGRSDTQESEAIPMMEEESNVIELVDENGESVSFEHLATLEHEGAYYIALMLLDDDHSSDDEEGEVVMMQISEDENGSECYVPVEDDGLQAVVFEKFLALMAEDEGGVVDDA